MNETSVMTLRLPKDVKRDVERLAARFGHKPAQLGARFIEEGLRRRDFPQIDLRETAAGRVAYVGGTRFAVYWLAGFVPAQMTAEAFAREYNVPVERVQAALTYAKTYADEIASDRLHAKTNQKWIEQQDATAGARATSAKPKAAKSKGNAAR